MQFVGFVRLAYKEATGLHGVLDILGDTVEG